MFLGELVLSLLMAIPLGQETADVRLRITVFEVPSMIVSMTWAGPSKDGGVVGTTVGGNTTWSFPNEPVFLQDELPDQSDSTRIITAIRKHMVYGCIREQMITAFEKAQNELVLNKQTAAQEVFRRFAEGGGRNALRLAVEAAWQNEAEAGIALRAWLRWQDPYGIQEIEDRLPERLVVDRVLPMKFGRTSLLGFPSSTSRARRSGFWLALSAEKTSN